MKMADGLAYAMASVDVGHREHQADHFSVGRASTKLKDRCFMLVSCVLVRLRPHWKYVKTTQATHSECDRYSMLTSDCVQLSISGKV
jgi:hypothetical protein